MRIGIGSGLIGGKLGKIFAPAKHRRAATSELATFVERR
jgi:hypothetical protein